MSWQKYEEDCKGCRPVIAKLSGETLADDDPAMKALLDVWGGMSLAEKRAWHRVTCKNSRALADLLVAQSMMQKFQRKLE